MTSILRCSVNGSLMKDTVKAVYLRMISQQDETLHYIHGVPRHGEHFGHEVTVTLEEGDGSQLDIEEQS